ncbi:hypothetical protein OAP25_01670 [Flavobacteriaceae bacterium]|nr:hypothetical protein [Flavobacteriaceae bacterium]
MNQLLTKSGLVAMILALWAESVELSFVVALVVLLWHFNGRLSQGLSQMAMLILALIAIGSLGLLSMQAGLYGFVKDLVYFLRPLTVLLATYYSVQRLDRKEDFYNLIVLAGFGFALFHLLDIGVGLLRYKPNLQKFRELFGKLNHVEMVALFLVACVKTLPVKKSRFKIIYQLCVAALIFSFLLYFSRTMIVVFFLMVLAYKGYLKLNARGAVMLSILAIVGAGFVFFLDQYDPTQVKEPTVASRFLEKVKNSYTEAFEPIKFDRYRLDRRELWPRWRAYEASLVLEEVDQERKWVQGKGFGSTVDVGFEVRLNGELMQHLPTVHNGITYVYMKTGLLGLLLYGSIILLLYLHSYRQASSQRTKQYHNVLVAVGLYMLAASMVVTGIFKPYMMICYLAGGTFALKQYAP